MRRVRTAPRTTPSSSHSSRLLTNTPRDQVRVGASAQPGAAARSPSFRRRRTSADLAGPCWSRFTLPRSRSGPGRGFPATQDEGQWAGPVRRQRRVCDGQPAADASPSPACRVTAYVWGGGGARGPSGGGFDCSGLTQYAYHQVGLDLPASPTPSTPRRVRLRHLHHLLRHRQRRPPHHHRHLHRRPHQLPRQHRPHRHPHPLPNPARQLPRLRRQLAPVRSLALA